LLSQLGQFLRAEDDKRGHKDEYHFLDAKRAHRNHLPTPKASI
jgi:hypothetical protein